MNKFEALNAFWSSFGLTAYDDSAVPSNAQLPYLTYRNIDGEFTRPVQCDVSLWYYGTSLEPVTQKAMEIDAVLSNGGKLVGYTGGGFWIRKGSPFYQTMGDASNDMIRRGIIITEIEYI